MSLFPDEPTLLEGVTDAAWNAHVIATRGPSAAVRIPAPGTDLTERATVLSEALNVPWLAAFDSLAVLDTLTRTDPAVADALDAWWAAHADHLSRAS